VTPLLDIQDLGIGYATERGTLQALRHVSLQVQPGEILGLAGESGCGKSTLISALLHLLPDNATVTGGSIRFGGEEMLGASQTRLRAMRGQEIAVVFQDPMTALNPVLTIGRQMRDIQYRLNIGRAEKNRRSAEMLGRVGLPDPEARLHDYPHELSGGMRQRVAIAMAALMKPRLLIADEPTTALDATLEVQIIELLRELQQEIGCAILFVTHHLAVIAELCDRVVVMYAGQSVEEGPVAQAFGAPAHPYTARLIDCDPGRLERRVPVLPSIPGTLPSLIEPPAGCIFRPRCDRADDRCETDPPRISLGNGHRALCHHPERSRT
jgi:peptide/nickel transport system ATP-binding protein